MDVKSSVWVWAEHPNVRKSQKIMTKTIQNANEKKAVSLDHFIEKLFSFI